MTGEDRPLHAQDQLLTRIDAAADRGLLGARRTVYGGVQSDSGSYGCAVAAGVVLGGIALALFLTGKGLFAVLPVGMLLLILVGLWYDSFTSKRNRGFQLDLYEHGLTAAVKDRVHAVRYDNTTVFQRTVRHTGTAGYTTYEYSLTDIDGEKLVLRGRSDGVAKKGYFAKPKEWGTAIQQAVTRAQLPMALATLDAGQSLDFGKLWLTREEVGSARESVQWSQIQEVRVVDGFIKVKIAGKWRSLGSTALTSPSVAGTPNFFVFLALADHLRGPGRGRSG
ncbi:DUF6585 family protein [Streptomyces sp. IBSNAI002]|uniref:DUF6585 family protein n=1 Tax=Streptomyces sp. IBSNAI002 TaxID=3457500 RepID=UPI003FD12EEB